jgi:rRNA maturation RNase YbeY
LESVKQNAARYGISFRKELFRVIIHGILHICGYNDSKKTEKVLMRKKENYYLKYLK